MACEFKVGVKNTFISVEGLEVRDLTFPRQSSAPTRGLSPDPQSDVADHDGYSVASDSIVADEDDDNDYASVSEYCYHVDIRDQTLGESHEQLQGASSSTPSRMRASAECFRSASAGGVQDSCGVDVGEIPAEWQDKTTVMVRNLSYKCTPAMFRNELNASGFHDSFDYVYVPVNGGGSTSKGYAFINFLDSITAYKFKLQFDAKMMNIHGSKKLLEVIPAKLQGYQNNVSQHEQTSSSSSRRRDNFRADEYSAVMKQNRQRGDEFFPQRSNEPLLQQEAWTYFDYPQDYSQDYTHSQCQVPGPQCASRVEQSMTPGICAQCNIFGSHGHRFCQFCGSTLTFCPD